MMRYQRVLLVSLMYPTGVNTLAAQPPAGLGAIAEALEGHVDYEVCDLSLGYRRQQLFEQVRRFQPDAIAISMMTFNYRKSYALCQELKARFPHTEIVVGGPHLSTMRQKVLAECPAIDYGVVLEGEETFIRLCVGKDPAQLPGLLWRQGSGITYNGDTVIADLDKLPFPRYGKFELDRYLVRRMKIVTSRGCPYDCIYCPVEAAIGRRFRARSPESVLAEIRYWYERGYREFDIVDDNFTFLKERVEMLCELLERSGMSITLHCPNGIRADKVDRHLLERMRSVGFKTLAFGVEAGNDRMLEVLHKRESLQQIEEAIGNACALGFDVILFFLLGSPYETEADVDDSLRLAGKYPVYEARFYNLIPFPHTELYRWVTDNQYFLRSPDDYLNDASHFENVPCFATPQLPAARRIALFQKAAGVSRRIKYAALCRRLKGYGFFSRPVAALFLCRGFRYIYERSRFLRRLVEGLKSAV